MNSLRTLFVFLLILVVASFFRMHALDTTPPGLYPDEAMNGNNALEALESPPPEGGVKAFYPENNGREGLFINIQGFFLKVLVPRAGGNPEPWMLRLPSALFGIITVAGVFFLAKELFRNEELGITNKELGDDERRHNSKFIIHNSNAVALLSTFLIAVSFWHINFSRIGFRAIMAPCFLVWGVYLLLLAFRKWREFPDSPPAESTPKKYKSIIRNSLFPLFAGIVYGLGMHSYIAYRATPLVIAVILFLFVLKIGWKPVLKITTWFVLGALVVSLPLISYFAQNPEDFFGRTSDVSVFSSPSPLGELGMNIIKTVGMLFFIGDSNWRHNLSGAPELLWPVAILFLLGVIVGTRALFRKNSGSDRDIKTGAWILFAWFLTALLPVVFSNEGIPHALRSILMIPPIFILAGLGGVTFYEWMRRKLQPVSWQWVLPVAASLLLLFVAVTAYRDYFIVWGQDRNTAGAFSEEYVTIGRKLNAVPQNIPKYVVVEAGGVLVRGIPMPTQTVMYITNTFSEERQKEKNIRYILPQESGSIPEGSYVTVIR